MVFIFYKSTLNLLHYHLSTCVCACVCIFYSLIIYHFFNIYQENLHIVIDFFSTKNWTSWIFASRDPVFNALLWYCYSSSLHNLSCMLLRDLVNTEKDCSETLSHTLEQELGTYFVSFSIITFLISKDLRLLSTITAKCTLYWNTNMWRFLGQDLGRTVRLPLEHAL